jgi:hypothetical protein
VDLERKFLAIWKIGHVHGAIYFFHRGLPHPRRRSVLNANLLAAEFEKRAVTSVTKLPASCANFQSPASPKEGAFRDNLGCSGEKARGGWWCVHRYVVLHVRSTSAFSLQDACRKKTDLCTEYSVGVCQLFDTLALQLV